MKWRAISTSVTSVSPAISPRRRASGLATAGATGLLAGFLYEELGRLAVTTTSAAVMIAFVALARVRVLGRADVAPVGGA